MRLQKDLLQEAYPQKAAPEILSSQIPLSIYADKLAYKQTISNLKIAAC